MPHYGIRGATWPTIISNKDRIVFLIAYELDVAFGKLFFDHRCIGLTFRHLKALTKKPVRLFDNNLSFQNIEILRQ